MSCPIIIAILVLCGCSTIIFPADSARILAVELTGGRSHWNFMRSVLQSLIEKGHNLTIFSPFSDIEGCGVNCSLIDTSKDYPNTGPINLATVLKTLSSTVSLISQSVNFTRNRCNAMYNNTDINKILTVRNNSDYEVLIIEPMATECASHIAGILRIPVVYLIPSPMLTFVEPILFGHTPNPAVVSHILSQRAVLRKFVQRCINSVLLAYSLISREYYERIIKTAHPQSYDSIESVKPSLVFVNSHYITEPSRPMPPNLIPIGGIHLSQPNTIPKDILEFIENSPHGVIYFTFGSVVSMSTLPDHIQNAFKEALAQVPLRVLWKYEGEMKDKPINVMTSKWFPQRDILMHPNVKLFISHGGISGVYEAVDAGVPVLGFPLFYDQPRNIDNLVEAGMGISMDLLTLQKDELLTNILELINNEKYMENAKIVSDRFKDRPMSPAESVVYWTEYVIRHKGAPHLKSHALDLTWYQYFLLDVIFVILILISFVIFITYKLFKTIYYYFLKYSQTIKPKLE
ncbi:UDP-glucosyltransferase 2-like isoform X2 [Metopolophium dirhodum]|uniref:UDP-glucosyltransferase 2-like isoform X2 n=1 Tax=Metopolophium dirhodum TaxID=44670 RepID=UPI00298F919F|nr:UDP-glucosyltransferase 2-like isoform X2 [Metopolophium dirhodum]